MWRLLWNEGVVWKRGRCIKKGGRYVIQGLTPETNESSDTVHITIHSHLKQPVDPALSAVGIKLPHQ